MYKDKEEERQANKERQRRYRDKQKGVTSEGVTEEGVTLYPAIIIALADTVKRGKLERITQSLKSHNVLESVRYGVSGPTFSTVEKYLYVLK